MKNKLYSVWIIGLTCMVTWPAFMHGQNLEELKRQFPQDHAILLNNNLAYHISINNGEPLVESRELQQIEFLSPEASRYLSGFSFYHSDFQQVVSYDAYTRTARDKKLKVSDFKTSSSSADFVFYDDAKETSFHFPSVDEGAVGNLEVSRINKNPHLLTPFYFARGVPVLNSELSVTFPKNMVIRYRLFGSDTTNVSVKTEKTHKEWTYTFSYKNCLASKRYADAPANPWFATHVIFYIDRYQDDKGQTVQYLGSLDDFYRLSYGYISQINSKITPALKHIVDSLTNGILNPVQKAKNIYSWVQHHIKYVAFEQGMEGFVPRDAGIVCSRRFGDCKDMSSILTVMMREAGITAYFTWIGTRDLPYRFSDLPLPLICNHMICTIQLNGEYVFLDGTDPDCIFGYPTYAIQDKEAMISINEKEYKILKVPIIDKAKNTVTDSTWLELTPTGIQGSIKKTVTGYFSNKTRGSLARITQGNLKQEMKQQLSRGSNKFQLDSVTILPYTSPDSTQITARFSLPDYAKHLDDEWFLNLNLFKLFVDEEIDHPKRKMPIEYSFGSVRNYVVLVRAPAGYRFESVPSGKSFHNEVWGFDLHYKQQGDWLVLTQHFDNDHLMITSDQFGSWNKVLENLYPLYKETVSLSKNP